MKNGQLEYCGIANAVNNSYLRMVYRPYSAHLWDFMVMVDYWVYYVKFCFLFSGTGISV